MQLSMSMVGSLRVVSLTHNLTALYGAPEDRMSLQLRHSRRRWSPDDPSKKPLRKYGVRTRLTDLERMMPINNGQTDNE